MFQTSSFRSTVYNPSRFQRKNRNNNLQLVIIISLIGVIFITYYNTSNNLDGVISALRFSSTSTSTSTSTELDDGNFHGRYPNSLLTLFYPYTMFRDVVLDQPINMTDIPFFWHVHNSDEYIYKKVLTNCYGLEIIELNDISSIQRAKEVNLISSSGIHRSTHVITSPFIRETAEIFTTNHFGRMICFFRHPLDYDIHTSLPQTFIKKDNWLTRLLSNIHEDELNQYHLAVAKQVIRQNCLVGTLDKMKLSIIRFQKHWGWKYTNEMTIEEGEQCIDDAMNSVGIPQETWIDHDSEEFKSFYELNYFDCQLYELSQSAWRHQLQTIVPWELQLSRDKDDDE